MMRAAAFAAIGAMALCGCLWQGSRTPRSNDVIRSKSSPVTVPANLEAASKVDSLGRRILSANPGIAAKPIFQTIGAPHPELFHQGTNYIYLTQGLVQRCATEAELAGVLCYELARMVAERETAAPLNNRQRETLPPMDPGLSKDVVGAQTQPDQFRLAELAKFEKERAESLSASGLIDPWKLARLYMQKSGFATADLDSARPHIEAATEHFDLEKQITGAGMPTPFSPRR
jgi:hypothetical protein